MRAAAAIAGKPGSRVRGARRSAGYLPLDKLLSSNGNLLPIRLEKGGYRAPVLAGIHRDRAMGMPGEVAGRLCLRPARGMLSIPVEVGGVSEAWRHSTGAGGVKPGGESHPATGRPERGLTGEISVKCLFPLEKRLNIYFRP